MFGNCRCDVVLGGIFYAQTPHGLAEHRDAARFYRMLPYAFCDLIYRRQGR